MSQTNRFYVRAGLMGLYFGAVLSAAPLAFGGPVLEVGDAGDLPGSAHPTGAGAVPTIAGSIATATDADMYAITITTPAAFSASTIGPTGVGILSDTQLFLFDSSGMGIYANDDSPSGGLRSLLPLKGDLSFNPNGLGPSAPGLYYLVVTSYNTDPVSGAGLIFPNTPFNVVHGPTGAGGGSPISGYSHTTGTAVGDYTIRLTGTSGFAGTVVPLPPAVWGGLAMLSSIGILKARRRTRYPQL